MTLRCPVVWHRVNPTGTSALPKEAPHSKCALRSSLSLCLSCPPNCPNQPAPARGKEGVPQALECEPPSLSSWPPLRPAFPHPFLTTGISHPHFSSLAFKRVQDSLIVETASLDPRAPSLLQCPLFLVTLLGVTHTPSPSSPLDPWLLAFSVISSLH